MGVIHYTDPTGAKWQELTYRELPKLEVLQNQYQKEGWKTWLHEDMGGKWVLVMMKGGYRG